MSLEPMAIQGSPRNEASESLTVRSGETGAATFPAPKSPSVHGALASHLAGLSAPNMLVSAKITAATQTIDGPAGVSRT